MSRQLTLARKRMVFEYLELKQGDLVQVNVDNHVFKGAVLNVNRNGYMSNCLVRCYILKIGVEQLFPLYAENIKIKVLEKSKLTKLYPMEILRRNQKLIDWKYFN